MSKNEPTAEEIAAAEAAAAEQAASDAAAAAAGDAGKAPVPADAVSYRVLPKGDGQVFTGLDNPQTFSHGDQVDGVALSIALELQERGFVEILRG